MKAILFGANGQDGYFLSSLLCEKGVTVVPVSRSGNGIRGDVGRYDFVSGLIAAERPDYIFHLAANSTTKHTAIFENHNAISTGTLNILESVRLSVPEAKVFLSGSAMQFRNDGVPISEKTPFAAGSPYAVARIQSAYAGRYFRERFGLQVYIGYFFNHDSWLRTERHINQRIVRSLRRISQGSPECIEVGDLDVKKEFNFAGDIVRAIWVLVSQDTIYEAVIGSGIGYSIRQWLDYCSNRVGVRWERRFLERKNFKAEYTTLISDPSLLKRLGWSPEVGFFQLADMMLEKTV